MITKNEEIRFRITVAVLRMLPLVLVALALFMRFD